MSFRSSIPLLLALTWLHGASNLLPAQEVIQITWPTRHAAEPPTLNEQQRQWLPAFQMAVAALPEESLIAMALMQGPLLGLGDAEGKRLQTLFSNYYARVRQSAPFRNTPSALPYCFAQTKPAHGLATVYLPANVTTSTRTVLFLHGYGGSLLAYLHFIANTFSNDIVICPAYGIAPAAIPAAYIDEALKATSERVKNKRGKPLLIGLSAGGVGACRVYAANSSAFQRLICLGSIPPADAISKFSSSAKISFISGAREPHITDGSFELRLSQIRSRAASVSSELIPGADHYFLLSHGPQTRAALIKAAP